MIFEFFFKVFVRFSKSTDFQSASKWVFIYGCLLSS